MQVLTGKAGLGPMMALCVVGAVGCGSSDDGTTRPEDPTLGSGGEGPDTDPVAPVGECGEAAPTSYDFPSRFVDGESSVSYSGQIARHVLVAELADFIGGLTEQIDGGTSYGPGDLSAALALYVENPDGVLDEEPIALSLSGEPSIDEATHGDISSGKNLIDKLAGNDAATDHAVWTDPGTFQGWQDTSLGDTGQTSFSPESLLRAMFAELEQNAVGRSNGEFRTGPDDETLPVHVTAAGLDLQQLVQKFLLGAVMFSQGADDYLSNDVDGKGLLSSNEQDEDAPYSALEHAWDEGFGYFGAARDYDAYTDDEIAGKDGREAYKFSWHDANGDCRISLTSEMNFGASINAAKRDRGSVVATDFTADAFEAFTEGRRILAESDGPLTDAEMAELVDARDRAVAAWEDAIAATVVHYINETVADLDAALEGSADYAFTDQAKHWSELKGFALAFQFNPTSPLSGSTFAEIHRLIRDAPVVPDALPQPANITDLESYRSDLLSARDLITAACAFDLANAEAW